MIMERVCLKVVTMKVEAPSDQSCQAVALSSMKGSGGMVLQMGMAVEVSLIIGTFLAYGRRVIQNPAGLLCTRPRVGKCTEGTFDDQLRPHGSARMKWPGGGVHWRSAAWLFLRKRHPLLCRWTSVLWKLCE